MDFNFETGRVENGLTVENLLRFLSDLHSELTDTGVLPDGVSTETHQQLQVLASEADARGLTE